MACWNSVRWQCDNNVRQPGISRTEGLRRLIERNGRRGVLTGSGGRWRTRAGTGPQVLRENGYVRYEEIRRHCTSQGQDQVGRRPPRPRPPCPAATPRIEKCSYTVLGETHNETGCRCDDSGLCR